MYFATPRRPTLSHCVLKCLSVSHSVCLTVYSKCLALSYRVSLCLTASRSADRDEAKTKMEALRGRKEKDDQMFEYEMRGQLRSIHHEEKIHLFMAAKGNERADYKAERVARLKKQCEDTPCDVTQTPRDVTQTSRGRVQQSIKQAPRDVTQAPRNVAQTPLDVTQTPRDVTQTPRDAAQTPRDGVQQAVMQAPPDVTQTPRGVIQTPRHVTRRPHKGASPRVSHKRKGRKSKQK